MNKKRILIPLILLSILVIIICIFLFTKSKLNESVKLGELDVMNGKVENKVSTYVTNDIKKSAENGDVSVEFNKKVTLNELVNSAENIAIVRIISLDSSSAEYDHVVGKTYGRLIINTAIKGNLKEGTVVDYAALGGYLKITEWEQYQPEAANAKRKLLRGQNGIKVDDNSYIHLQFDDCIDVEAGKTYLAYLNYNKNMQKYEIIGFGDGFMELSIDSEQENISTININTNEVKILNNYTKEYENLDEYINKIKATMQ